MNNYLTPDINVNNDYINQRFQIREENEYIKKSLQEVGGLQEGLRKREQTLKNI